MTAQEAFEQKLILSPKFQKPFTNYHSLMRYLRNMKVAKKSKTAPFRLTKSQIKRLNNYAMKVL